MTDCRGKYTRSEETKRKISDANRLGEYETPWGWHRSTYEASRYIDLNLSTATIGRMCRDADRTITKHRYSRNQFLQTLGPWVIGKTYREIGFSFIAK